LFCVFVLVGFFVANLALSKFTEEYLQRALLDALFCRLAQTEQGLQQFVSKTLYGSESSESLTTLTKAALDFLVGKGFIALAGDAKLSLSNLGRGCVRCVTPVLSPAECLQMNERLLRVMEAGLILKGDLHLLSLITPQDHSARQLTVSPQYMPSIFRKLNAEESNVAKRFMVNEERLIQREASLHYGVQVCTESDRLSDRFFATLVLRDLVSEVPLPVIQRKYKILAGDLESAQKDVASSAFNLVSFCREMEYESLELLLKSLVSRLEFGIKQELTELMEIRGVKKARARALWNAGFKTAKAVATANPQELTDKFGKKLPVIKIITAARDLLERRAEQLRLQAADYSSYSSAASLRY
jgi:replicative superfamily II helicase